MLCPDVAPGPRTEVLEAYLEGKCVVVEGRGKRYKLCAKSLADLARAAYHLALKVARGDEGCVEPLKGGEPFKGLERWTEEEGFAKAVEFMVLGLSPAFAKLYGKLRRVSYDPSTGKVTWST